MSGYTKEEINSALIKLAYMKTTPFCYSCYEDAPKGVCEKCQSDDLMRHLPGYGVEYGIEWVIEHILFEELEEPNFDDLFESFIDDCYGDSIKVGWIDFNPAQLIKKMDPISWDIAKSEYIDGLACDKQILTFDNGSNYYWADDIISLLEENGIDIEEIEPCKVS